jgi:hypothetical protein
MAVHSDVQSMSIEAIDEYLAIAEHCISTRKTNGGLYGYPSVLLLFCVIDALSNFVGYGNNTLRGIEAIVPGLTESQIKRLKDWFRNLSAHQAIIMPGTQLSDEPTGNPIEFNSQGEPTHIRVIPFYQSVKSGWDAFDRRKIAPTFQQNKAPKEPMLTTVSPLPGVSGCKVTTQGVSNSPNYLWRRKR